MKLATADPHFGHKNIIKFCNRPFSNVKEMDETLIKHWNNVTDDNDEIHVVGDFAYGCTMEYALSVIKKLKGVKHLVTGNHDSLAIRMNSIRPNTWKTIKEMDEITIQNQRVVLCHYSLRVWHHSYRGVIHLFGHTHGSLAPLGKSFDIGVDCWNFTPVTENQILEKANTLPIHELIHNKWDKSGEDDITS